MKSPLSSLSEAYLMLDVKDNKSGLTEAIKL